jgi:lysophospholipase L1-like esterase
MKRVAALLLVVVLGLGLGGLALEIGVRILLPMSDFFWQWDAVTGVRLIPNAHGRSVKRGLFDVAVSTNSDGFRDREHTRAKPAGRYRVVLLGDSFIEAMQVPFEASVTPLLEERLRRGGTDAEVINLGVSGFGTAREYLALQEYGLRYQPDLVVLFFVGNDVSDNSQRLDGRPHLPYPVVAADGSLIRDAAGAPRFTPFADRVSRVSGLTAVFKQHSKVYRLMRETVDASPGLNGLLYRAGLMSTPPLRVNAPDPSNFGFYEIYRPSDRPEWAAAWRSTEDLLLAVRDLTRRGGAELVVVLVPGSWEVDPQSWAEVQARIPGMRGVPMDLERPSRRLNAFLAANGVPVVDLLPGFRAENPARRPLYIRGDAHWNAAGHRLAADLLIEPMRVVIGHGAAAESTDRIATAPNDPSGKGRRLVH